MSMPPVAIVRSFAPKRSLPLSRLSIPLMLRELPRSAVALLPMLRCRLCRELPEDVNVSAPERPDVLMILTSEVVLPANAPLATNRLPPVPIVSAWPLSSSVPDERERLPLTVRSCESVTVPGKLSVTFVSPLPDNSALVEAVVAV